jgi:NADH:ubiquinone reductase (non-electrogenic)
MSPSSSRPRIVILGSGFGALRAAQKLRRSPADLTIVSPRNHFLFTPLLINSAVGSAESRNIIEPIRDACPHAAYYQAEAVSLDPEHAIVTCQSPLDGTEFDLPYDHLVIAVGGKNGTFGIPGVEEHTLFLKEVKHAELIRQRILGCLERASLPTTSPEDRSRLLHWVVIGGGATGSEFVAELHNFLTDVRTHYPEAVDGIRLTLLEATSEILPSFDQSLRSYAERQLRAEHISIRKESPAKEIQQERVILEDGEEIPAGLIVWSTGITPRDWCADCGLPTTSGGFLKTDNECRVEGHEHIYAIGDAARIEDASFPATAQLAQQQGKYLGKALTRRLKEKPVKPFHFNNLGMMASLGNNRAMADLPKGAVTGRVAWWMWKSVYLTKLVGWRNKIRLLNDWIHTRLFGRETSRIP